MSPEERVITAIEHREPDRVPLFELTANPRPILQVILPFPLNKAAGNEKIYGDVIGCVRESYGMEPKKKSMHRAIIRPMVRYLSKLPTTYERAAWLAKQYLRTPVKLGYDAWSIPIFPALILDGIAEKDGKNYIRDKQNVLYDIDPVSGDPRTPDVFYPPMKQLEEYIKTCTSYIEHPDEIMEYGRMIMNHRIGGQKIKERVCLVGSFSFFETWYSIYGISNMGVFFRQVFSECRNGNRGPYHDMLEAKLKLYTELMGMLSEDGMKVVITCEDCATQGGPMIPPEVYKTYFFPLVKKFCDEAHKSGMKALMHTDGMLKMPGREDPWEFMRLLVGTGIDGIHPIEDGVNDIGEFKRVWGDKLCLVGNVDTDMLENGTPAQVTEAVREKIRVAGKGGGYICASDNSIHAGTDVRNWKAMIKAVYRYGRYDRKSINGGTQ